MTIREEMRAALSSLEILPPHETNSLLHSDMHDTPYAKDKSTTTVNSPSSDNSITTTDINNENNISSLTPNSKKNVSKRRSQVKNACGRYPNSTSNYYIASVTQTCSRAALNLILNIIFSFYILL